MSGVLFTIFVNCWVIDPILGVTADSCAALNGDPTLDNIISKAKNNRAAKINKAAKEKHASLK